MNLQVILRQLGYSPRPSQADKIISESFTEALDMLGELPSQALQRYMSSRYGVPESELLADYELLASALHDLLGNGAAVIMALAKQRMLPRVGQDKANLALGEIVKELRAKDAFEFVRQIPAHEHVTLLYSTDDTKDSMIAQFLEPSAAGRTPRGLFSVRPTTLGVSNMVYDELLGIEKQEAMKRAYEWVLKLHSSNTTGAATRIAGEDAWFFENGFEKEILDLEKAVKRRIDDNMSILCTYNVAKVPERSISAVIDTHGYVILGDALTVYKAEES